MSSAAGNERKIHQNKEVQSSRKRRNKHAERFDKDVEKKNLSEARERLDVVTTRTEEQIPPWLCFYCQ